MNGRQIHLLVLRSSCQPSSIHFLILVFERVRDEPGGRVSHFFRNETEGLTYLSQSNGEGGWGVLLQACSTNPCLYVLILWWHDEFSSREGHAEEAVKGFSIFRIQKKLWERISHIDKQRFLEHAYRPATRKHQDFVILLQVRTCNE